MSKRTGMNNTTAGTKNTRFAVYDYQTGKERVERKKPTTKESPQSPTEILTQLLAIQKTERERMMTVDRPGINDMPMSTFIEQMATLYNPYPVTQ
jgi:alpha-D-ribose 1-methylphosphonate 5-triphosphate synthase subunit PhnH